MKKTIGYLFNENHPKVDEKLFEKEAKKRDMNVLMINTAKDIKEKEIEEIAKKCDIFYNSSAEEFAREISKTIESFGKKVIGSSKEYYYDEDKWMFFLKCNTHNIPTPKTILLSENKNIVKKELKEFGCWPVILKRIEGTMGEYVEKADNIEQAEKIISRFWKKGTEKLPIIAQEFISSPSYRVTIIGDKIVQTAVKKNKGWKSTGVYEKKFDKFDIDKNLEKIITKIIKITKIKVCGLDFLKKGEDWKVLEINAQPAFDFFEEEREKIIGHLAEFIRKEIS